MWLFGKDKQKKPSPAVDNPAARREALKAEAMANARAAREAIGDETLQKIAKALSEQNKSPGKRAQDQIRAMDNGHVADHIKSLLDES